MVKLWIPGVEGVSKPTRQQALEELAKTSREIRARHERGELSLVEAERELHKLNQRYETIWDRLLAV